MKTFKIGDRVRILTNENADSGLNKGDIKTIISVEYTIQPCRSVCIIGLECSYYIADIASGKTPNWIVYKENPMVELVEEKKMRQFKQGDRVVVYDSGYRYIGVLKSYYLHDKDFEENHRFVLHHDDVNLRHLIVHVKQCYHLKKKTKAKVACPCNTKREHKKTQCKGKFII